MDSWLVSIVAVLRLFFSAVFKACPFEMSRKTFFYHKNIKAVSPFNLLYFCCDKLAAQTIIHFCRNDVHLLSIALRCVRPSALTSFRFKATTKNARHSATHWLVMQRSENARDQKTPKFRLKAQQMGVSFSHEFSLLHRDNRTRTWFS